MKLKNKIWNLISRFVSWGMGRIPYITVWTAEKAFFIAPTILRKWVDRYTSERILACVVGGSLPMLPNFPGGDIILFYPLKQCIRYQVLELPQIKPLELFDGHILAFTIPTNQRLKQYHVCGYDLAGTCFDAGLLYSNSAHANTKFVDGIDVLNNKIKWTTRSKNYLTSFIMVHSDGKPHAAGYSQRSYWNYPTTDFLPHVVIPPDGKNLLSKNISIMILIVDKDAWVPEIITWRSP